MNNCIRLFITILFLSCINYCVAQATLTPGTISTSENNITYNSSPTVLTTPASGAYNCFSEGFSYTWERLIPNHFWEVIGAGEQYPSSVPPIITTTRLRRKVQCHDLIIYSNVLTISPLYVSSTVENMNYVRVNNITVSNVQSWHEANQLPIGNRFQTTTYSDGLQRKIQEVINGGSFTNGVQKDIVTPIEYDELGRVVKSYLPYVTNINTGQYKTDAVVAQSQYINNLFWETQSYAKTEYDNSPLNRVLKSMEPGNNFAGNNIGISSDYDVNTANENVHTWQIDFTAGSVPTTSPTTVYNDAQLFKNITTDENGKKIITYTDKSGNTILKKVQSSNTPGIDHSGWLSTYYVYDDFGRQRFIIPPKVVAYLDTHNWVLNNDVLNELCFSYEYDKRGRLIIKKSPGAEPVYMVYDQRDRLVFSQDGNQRHQTTKNWTVTLYDNLDRVTLTGLIDYNSTRDNLQSFIDNIAIDSDNGNVNVTSSNAPVVNLVVDIRNIPTGTDPGYTASNSITFYPGFTTETGANFIAQIDPAVQSVNNNVAVNTNPLPAGNNLYTLTISYYDDYSYTGAKTFSTGFTKDNSVPSNESETVQKSLLTRGIVTGTKVRLLDGGNTFLTTTSFYDDKGRAIQLQGDNHNGFTDEATTQFDFSGKVRSTYEVTKAYSTNSVSIFTKNTYDILGRVTAIGKSINGSSEKTIASYAYNELGQLANKKLAPGFAGEDGPQLESLDYSYNIHGSLLGINKDYSASGTREGHYFGMELGYDRTGTHGFSNTQLNGNIAGNAWKTRGDNTIRKYDYAYDNINQLISASFIQRNTTASGWSQDKMNFTSNYSYDENGNIKTQNQWGVAPGTVPQQMDGLVYHYDMVTGGWSNRLSSIEEQQTVAVNGKLGDFKNGTVGSSAQQYNYDYNGNLKKDLNKEIGDPNTAGIQYNFMDLPTLITFKNNNKTISYIYDAAGNKLRKILDEPAISNNPARHVETDYVNAFVYENYELQYFSYEEGRVRIIKPFGNPNEANYDGGGIAMPNGKQGVFDYFIKDHLTNVRMILTEEIKRNGDIATMEDANANIKQHEESVFGQIGGANEVDVTRVDRPTDPCGNYANGWVSNNYPNPSARVSKLSGLSHKMGPNVILKVMSGDKISAQAEYYYKANNPSGSGGSTIVSDIVSSLIGAISSDKTSGIVKGNLSIIQSNLNGVDGLSHFITDRNNSPIQNTNAPKAYLNFIFFDEQFNYTSENTIVDRVKIACDDARDPLRVISKEALKNGWVYIYLSNESDELVYFDNFSVSHERGRIIDENHYYSYGLKINAISSRAQGTILNKYGYQGDFAEHDEDTELDEFELRHYDPQIGRWTTTDPYNEFASPYLGMSNSPGGTVDPNGGCATCPQILPEIFIVGFRKLATSSEFTTMISNSILRALTTLTHSTPISLVPRFQINYNFSGFGDYTEITNERIRKEIDDYNALDHAHGQVDLSQSSFFGNRSYTGIDPTTGKYVDMAPVDNDGYLTHRPRLIGESPFGLFSPAGELSLLSEVNTLSKIAKDEKLLLNISKRAENAIPGEGSIIGVTRHTFAETMLNKYQGIYENRGLFTEFKQGASRLDVYDNANKIIYDYKFYKNGTAAISRSRLIKYINEFNPSSIKTINPKTGIFKIH